LPGVSASDLALPPDRLRWRCDPALLPFATTADVEPAEGIVGQPAAVDALQFGLEFRAPGQHVYVRGLTGTGRLTLVRRLLDKLRPPAAATPDYAYVHNFTHPDQPRLLRLPRGRGDQFAGRIDDLRRFITEELPASLDGDPLKIRRTELEQEMASAAEAATAPLEKDLAAAGLALVFARSQSGAQPTVVPLLDGQPADAERIAAARASGELSDEDLGALAKTADGFRVQVETAFAQVAKAQRQMKASMREVLRVEVHRILRAHTTDIRAEFPSEDVGAFLDCLLEDVCTRRLADLIGGEDITTVYEVNVLVSHSEDDRPPVIVEHAPSVQTLIGIIDASIDPTGRRHADHMSVHPGSLLLADGGVLVLEAREVLSHPGAWGALVRTLRTGRVEMVPPDVPVPWQLPSLKPEPIAIDVKVVLLGDPGLYYLLDAQDADFPNLFKVLADFDSVLPRDADGLAMYSSVLSRIARDEGRPHFDASAVAELAEHGARIASAAGHITARFGRLADLAREAAYLTVKRDEGPVTGEDVREAVRRTKRRGDGPARMRREHIADGTIRIATSGRAVGQLNGLAVIQAGPLTYGFPSRITATVAPGIGGTVNIEREASLSGAIHTKAFYILGGLLRSLLPVDFPLTFEASLAFEQSYGGIDGDSASGAEVCCLLSAITNLPIDQGLAMTGAIDQHGNVLPIGAVNEKIEGFYDTCVAQHGAAQGQGVLIPHTNAGDLMLRHDVVEACARGEFRVYAVTHIRDALELFFGRPAGTLDDEGRYPDGSVLGVAMARVRRLWEHAAPAGARPPRLYA
jgi:predicted ATP-dependent protease